MSRNLAMALCIYLLLGFAFAVYDVVDQSGRGFMNQATFGSAAIKGIAWPASLYKALAN